MKQLSLGFWLLCLAGVVACGGRAIVEPGGDSEPTGPAPTSSSPSKPSPGKGNPSGSLPSHALGECTPGFLRAEEPLRACRWLTESGMCFDDSDKACACICPADGDSVCAHGFDDGPNSATLIYCI